MFSFVRTSSGAPICRMIPGDDIRMIDRPTGTVVCDGRNGVYPVREKLSGGYWVDEEGKPYRPSRNGRVVGHIRDGIYVPKDPDLVPVGEVDLKDWGNVELFDRLNGDVLDHLRLFYNAEDSTRLYVMAILRASYRGITDHLMARQYQETFLTEMYPGVNLNRSSISTFLRNVGRSCARISDFMRFETSCMGEDEHVIIDGSLCQDHSRVNTLSEVSRKTAKRGYKDILLLYAYCMEKKRPICSKVYPGNMADQRAVSDFLEQFGICNGIIVADKGFTYVSLKEAVEKNKGLHYLLPIKRNSRVIEELSLCAFDELLAGEKCIQCKKASRVENGEKVWYYSFRDLSIALDEEIHYMSAHRADGIDMEDLERSRPLFGTIMFQSDFEMSCGTVYATYDSRWLIELFFRSQEDTMDMDDTREHSDYSVIASNFVNHLASIMLSNMFRFLDERKLLDDRAYGEVLGLLMRIKMTRTSSSGEWKVRRIAETDAEVLEKTGLLIRPIVPKEIKKRGRPKGSKDTKPRKKRSDPTESRGASQELPR